MRRQQQASSRKRSRAPLDPTTIRALALHYVGRYATTTGRLKTYLERKLRERGWTETAPPPDVDSLVENFASLGFVDNQSFATSRASSLLRRGYGPGRVNMALRQAGLPADAADSTACMEDESIWQAAMTFARRKRLGPFGAPLEDQKARARAMAAFIRAGHGAEIARKILATDKDDADLDDNYG